MRAPRAFTILTITLVLLLQAQPVAAVPAGSRIPWSGGSWYLLGANYPWYNYGNDFGANAWGAYGVHAAGTYSGVDADFAKMATEGIHTARWWVFADGRAGITFDAGGMPTGVDQYVFPDLDAALKIAANHNVYLDLVLLDFGFMSNATSVNGVQLGGHANVINTAAGQQALLNNVFSPVFTRYAHNPYVLSWEVMNEPEWAITEDGAVNSNISQPSTLANFQSFTRLVAAAVHANTGSYVTVGEAAMKWAPQWVGQGLDYYQIHYYDWMHPYSNTNLYGATYASLALDLPVVVGEFPAAGSSTASLQQYLDTWFTNGYAGAWPWSFRAIDSNGAPDATVFQSWATAHASAVNIPPAGQPAPTTVTAISPTSGPAAGGTSVTITGTGFIGATAVKFGSASATSYTVGSGTQISAISPPGTGTVNITVTTPAGTTATSVADQFTYVALPGAYHPLAPARVLDTRTGTALGPGQSINVPITGQGGVPATGVTAVVLNVTVTNTTAASYLTVYPTGVTRPLASNLNWSAGQTVPNLVEVAVGAGGQVSAYNLAGNVDVIFDVAGYVTATTGPDGLFNPLPPARILDTRSGTGGVTIGPATSIDLQVTGQGGVPASAVAAVVLNVTATNATASSYLTVFPTGATRPTASNLNFVARQTVPNRVMVKVGTGGRITIYNFSGTTDVVADVGGWFTDAASTAGGSVFSSITPARLLDTRTGTGPVGANATVTVSVGGAGIVPSTAKAVVLNVTVTNTTTPSYLTVWPDAVTRPTASDLNWVAGQTVPNLVVVKLGANGMVDVYNLAGSTDVVIDVVGWYS
jgi:hypothetical protein